MNWNRFKRKPNAKTAFAITEGQAIFSETIYLIDPIYIRRNAPNFSLVSKGKHISGFFEVSQGIYSGDFKGCLLLVLKSNKDDIELIKTDIPTNEGRRLLIRGELNSIIGKARNKGMLYDRV